MGELDRRCCLSNYAAQVKIVMGMEQSLVAATCVQPSLAVMLEFQWTIGDGGCKTMAYLPITTSNAKGTELNKLIVYYVWVCQYLAAYVLVNSHQYVRGRLYMLKAIDSRTETLPKKKKMLWISEGIRAKNARGLKC